MRTFSKIITLAMVFAVSLMSAEGFQSNNVIAKTSVSPIRPATTALSERKWNFNEGQGPWGLKKNAEIWNGRVAQVRSTM